MTKIKFGTDGWRAIIAQEFTVDNVARVAEGTAKWLLKSSKTPEIVLGHDCRFAGALFCETVAKVMCSLGVKVYLAKDFVSTPMISLGTVKLKKDLGIIITASHNPPEYNGFKLKGSFGGPLQPQYVAEIENLIPEKCSYDLDTIFIDALEANGMINYIDLETMYVDHVHANFDLEIIKKGILCCKAYSIPRAIFSPTTDPIEPPMKLKSIQVITILISDILPYAVRAASFKPDFFSVARTLST